MSNPAVSLCSAPARRRLVLLPGSAESVSRAPGSACAAGQAPPGSPGSRPAGCGPVEAFGLPVRCTRTTCRHYRTTLRRAAVPHPGSPPSGRPGAILPGVIVQEPALAEPATGVPGPEERERPTALAILLIVGGVLGLIAAFALTLDKFQALTHPSSNLSCDFNLLVQCGKNLGSPQGSAFGFPNPLIGLVGFPAPIFVGVSVLAGARFPRWFWAVFNAGLLFAIGFVIWLISVSIFQLGTLCPWCMLVWSVVIPMTLAVTFFNVAAGNLPLGGPARRVGSFLYGWTPLLSLLAYVTVAVLAQVRLDVLSTI